ncbi:trace amine-associated receptor 9-like [Oculina patagonica]
MANAVSPSSTNSSNPESEECHYLYDGSLWKETYLTEVTYPHLIALTVINLLAVIPAILLNAMIILAVVARHQLRTNSNILVACLAGTHLLGGLVAQPIAIAMEVKRILSDGPFCSMEKAFTVAKLGGGLTSLGTLVLLSLDRYIAIKHPLRYRTIVTKQRLITGLALAWTIGFLVTIQEIVLAVIDSGTEPYLQYSKVKDALLVLLGTFYIAVVTYTFCYIFLETRRQNKRLQTEQLPQEEAKRLKKENKATNTLTIILAALVLSYLPTIVIIAVVSSTNNVIPPHIISVLWSWISTVNQLGNLFDPIIFFWRVKKMRRAALEIVHYRQPENSPPPIEMMERKQYRPEMQPTTSEAFSVTVARQEPVLLSFLHNQAEEIICIE